MADKIAVMNAGADRAARHAAGDLRPAGVHVRRRLHRLAADELPALSTAALDAGAHAVELDGRRAFQCPNARGRRPGRGWCSGCARSMSASSDAAALRGQVFGAEYLGTTQIVTVVTDAGQIKARLPSSAASAGRRDGRSDFRFSSPVAVRCANRPAIRTARAPSVSEESAPMADVALGSQQALRRTSTAVRDLSLDRRRRRVRRAARPDRRRQDHDAAARRRPRAPGRRHGPHRRPRRHPRAAGARATSPSCSSNTRSIRT